MAREAAERRLQTTAADFGYAQSRGITDRDSKVAAPAAPRFALTRVKYAAFASQETPCFEATVLVDGRLAGTVRNAGHGGGNEYDPRSLEVTLNEYAAKLPKEGSGYSAVDQATGADAEVMYQPDADSVVGGLLEAFLLERDFRRGIKARGMFVRDGKVYQTRKFTPEQLRAWLSTAVVLPAYSDATILNTMPEAEALALYRAGTA
jgi:hypothetical protein